MMSKVSKCLAFFVVCVTACISFTCVNCAYAKSIVRINGTTLNAENYSIAISPQASSSEKFAASELQKHIVELADEKISILEINNADQLKTAHFISVGKTILIEKSKVSVDWDKLGKEGIFVRTVGSDLILAGGVRGVLYSCYSFLEDDLGVRWFTPKCTTYTKGGLIEIKSINREYVPKLMYREVGFQLAIDADWSVRNKCNGVLYNSKKHVTLDKAHGGQVNFGGVHSFSWLFLPAKEYFKDHPEYFALVDGKRIPDGQVCMTNQDVEDIVVNKILERARKNPDFNYVSVSQNDCYGNCQCEKCKAIDDREGTPAGSMLHFVNRVADRVGKEFPDVTISTLAYQYTEKAPKFMKPRKNVAVILCSIQSSFITPLYSDQNEKFCKAIKDWNRISDRLYIWDYNVNYPFCFQPHPCFDVLKSNINFFIDNGAKGIFEEGYHDDNYGELHELRMWILAKLLWNPSLGTNELIQEFLKGYYGNESAKSLYKYIRLMVNEAEKERPYMDCFAPYKRFKFLSEDNIKKAAHYFKQAQMAAGDNGEYLKRIQIASLPVLYMQILFEANEIDADKIASTSPAEKTKTIEAYLLKLDQFEKYAKFGDIHRRGSGGHDDGMPFDLPSWLEFMRAKVKN